MSDIGRNNRRQREKRRMTVSQLAAAITMDPSFLSRKENGRVRFKEHEIESVAQVFGMTVDELKSGAGSEMFSIPIEGMASASPSYNDEQQREYLRLPHEGLSENAYAVEVGGDSMHPTIKSGDVLVCEPVDLATNMYTVLDGSCVVLSLRNQMGVTNQVGRWAWLAQTGFMLLKDNPTYPTQKFQFADNEIYRLGRVVKLIRKQV